MHNLITHDEAPLLSVCLITYNHVLFIREAVEGVLMQEVDFPFEFIIADDYSTDGTRDILLEYKQKYPDLIKLILQERNVGANRNWADLIRAPKGKYVASFEGDDYWIEKNKLQRQVDFLEKHPEFSLCFHQVYELRNGAFSVSKLIESVIEQEFTIEDLAKENIIYLSSNMLRRSALPKDFPPHEFLELTAGDYPMYMLLAKNGKLKFFPEIMSVYRRHEGGIWSGLKTATILERWLKVLNYLIDRDFTQPVKQALFAQKRRCAEKYLKLLMNENDWPVFLEQLAVLSKGDEYISQKWLLEYYPKYVAAFTSSRSYRYSKPLYKIINKIKRKINL